MGQRIELGTDGLTRHRFTADEYDRMGQTGILGEGDRVELIRGEIITMVPIGPEHSGCLDYLTNVFAARLSGRVVVHPQNPVRTAVDTEPQPDLVLLNYRPDYYRLSHPTVHDILLLVEIAHSSLEYDRKIKLPIYAEDGVPEVWIVNVRDRLIHVHRKLENGRYTESLDVRGEERLYPLAFPDCSFTAGEILG